MISVYILNILPGEGLNRVFQFIVFEARAAIVATPICATTVGMNPDCQRGVISNDWGTGVPRLYVYLIPPEGVSGSPDGFSKIVTCISLLRLTIGVSWPVTAKVAIGAHLRTRTWTIYTIPSDSDCSRVTIARHAVEGALSLHGKQLCVRIPIRVE